MYNEGGFINHQGPRYCDMIGSCSEAKRVGSRSRYQLYYVTGHTGAMRVRGYPRR